jgi:hypothetical protein
MVPEPNEHEPAAEPILRYANYREVLSQLSNAELLSALDLGFWSWRGGCCTIRTSVPRFFRWPMRGWC